MVDVENKLKEFNITNYCKVGQGIYKLDETKYGKKHGKLILVTAMSPTKSGNGKTTVSIGLADALSKQYSTILSLREPSLGPVFGAKGGATGGGKCALVPSSKIDLHFSGDMHAITSANNLICACLDNHIFQGNELNIDINEIYISRALDMNDRALRDIVIGDKDHKRKEHFIITSATEIMAILCLSKNFKELQENVKKMVIAKSLDGKLITVDNLGISDSVCGLLSDAISSNAVLTKEDNLAFVHGGPFANIAHGASSIIATKMALSYADFVVTEAGFGADLGAEKFFDVVCPKLGKYPDAVVLIATIAALKENGYGDLNSGLKNLQKHIDNLTNLFGANLVVAVNNFGDSDAEINYVIDYCNNQGIKACKFDGYKSGSKGAKELASLIIEESSKKCTCKSLYNEKLGISAKIDTIAKNVYGAKSVSYSKKAEQKIQELEKLGYGKLPVVIAKTQYSFSCDDKLFGAPTDFEIPVTDVELRAGAGFVVAVCGKQLLMPALGKNPRAKTLKLKGKELLWKNGLMAKQ